MKSYTDLPQSKKLAEILPIESADMHYIIMGDDEDPQSMVGLGEYIGMLQTIPCWSLAALLNVLPKEIEIEGQSYAPCLFPVQDKWLLKLWYNSNYTIKSPISIFSDNLIDAYYEMIIRLHELKKL